MTKLIKFDVKNPGTPKDAPLPADRIVAGAPAFKVWEKESYGNGRVRAGIWEATPGSYKVSKGDNWEFCTLLQGVVELTVDGGETHLLKAGDTFVMRPGMTGTWKTIETVRKSWVVVAC